MVTGGFAAVGLGEKQFVGRGASPNYGWLPPAERREATSPEAVAMKQLPGNMGSSETALVVGDDPAVRRLTATILRQQGFGVIEARSMLEAGQRFAGGGDAIVLLIASLDAHEDDNVLAAVLRLIRRYGQLHVILTSTSSPDASDVEIMQAVGIRFLSLPFSFGRFSRAVADYAGVAPGEGPGFLPETVMRGSAPASQCIALQ